MAKIFRKIRQQLLLNNKVTKYLLYALGEILLVVIGILIALQVNNLNEQRKSNSKEKKHLTSLQNEMQNNLRIVNSEMEQLINSIDSQKKLISLINSDKDTISELYLSNIIGMSFSNVYELDYQDGTLKELLYSGGLISIKNDSIKNEITSWEGRMTAIRKQEKGVYETRDKILDYMIDNGYFKNVMDDVGVSNNMQLAKSIKRKNSKLILSSQKFENLVSYHVALNMSQVSFYKRLKGDIDNLLRMVNVELEP